MKQLVDMQLENLSTREVFLFRIACSACGAEFGGRKTRFSKAGIVPSTEEKKIIFDAIYEQELWDARQAAIRAATEHMNYCPICKRLVCNQCFMICDDLDMCVQCAGALGQQGNPVLPKVVEVAM